MTIKTLRPFLLITFGLTWGLALVLVLFPETITAVFGPLSLTNPLFLALLSVSVIMTALFNSSRGSLLLVVLVHFQLNNPIFPDAQPFDAITFTIAAAVVVWFCRKELFSSSGSVKDVLADATQK